MLTLISGKRRKRKAYCTGRSCLSDYFGNIVTNISSDSVADLKPGDILEIDKKRVIFQGHTALAKRAGLLLDREHEYLEIAVNKGNAAALFNKKTGMSFLFMEAQPMMGMEKRKKA